jgi:hypothetical protein
MAWTGNKKAFCVSEFAKTESIVTWNVVRNHRRTVTIDSVLANSKTQNAFLFPVHAMFRHACTPSGETCKYAMAPSTQKKETWRDSLPIDMLPFGVTIPANAPHRSEIPEGLMIYTVYIVKVTR